MIENFFEKIQNIPKTPFLVTLLTFYSQNLNARVKIPEIEIKNSVEFNFKKIATVVDNISEKFILNYFKNELNNIYFDNRKKFSKILNNSFFDKIIQIESSGNPKVRNKKSGATGLMQVTDIAIKDILETFKPDLKVSNSMIIKIKAEIINDPFFGKRIGELYFYVLYKRYQKRDSKKLIIAYNCGIGCSENKLPEETKKYWKKFQNLSKK